VSHVDFLNPIFLIVDMHIIRLGLILLCLGVKTSKVSLLV